MILIKLYHFLATIFWIVRQFAIPNPFDALGEGLVVTIGETPILLSPEFLNWIADPVVAAFTFGVVGLYYISRSAPALGSILYMFFYALHIGLLYLILSVYPAIWLMVLIGAIYVGIHIGVMVLKSALDWRY